MDSKKSPNPEDLLDGLAEIIFEIFEFEECAKSQHTTRECCQCTDALFATMRMK